MKKIKYFFKDIIKNNYKLILFYIVIILLFTLPLNYEIYTPGGLINLDKRIEIKDSYESKGSLNLTYVGGKKGIIPLILLSYIIPDWDLVNLKNSQIENENYGEIVERNKVYLKSVNQNAIIVAFKVANKEYEITGNRITILHVFEYADTNILTGDEIISVENIEFKDTTEFTEFIDKLEYNQKINIKVNRDGKIIDTYAVIQNIENKKYIGVYLANVEDVTTNPKVNIKFSRNEMGPSGGLMTALKIYDMLVEYDITKGDIISGTGTIESDGKVGAISGIKYKLAGAVKNKADVFIVPSDNYEEALNEKNKNNYDIELIKADTFDNVIKELINR